MKTSAYPDSSGGFFTLLNHVKPTVNSIPSRCMALPVLLTIMMFLLPSCFVLKFLCPDHNNPRYQIIAPGVSTAAQLTNFLIMHNPTLTREQANYLAQTYIRECAREKVNHDVAFAQMCLETGFLKFSGSIKANQNNFAGLGAVDHHTAGESFSSVELGVRAHIQHLKAYASREMPQSPTVDKRMKYVKKGSSPTIFHLSGRWAVDPRYGDKIKGLIDRLYRSHGEKPAPE